jgi:hypothetical protein
MAILLAALALFGPFTKADSVEAGGYPVLGSSPHGLTLRYIANEPFGVGIVLHNRSGAPVTVVDVRAEEPLGTLVHQIGTRLRAWNPPPCTGNHSCPASVFLRRPFRATRPAPLTIAPGRGLGVQLNFRLAGCAAVPLASRFDACRDDRAGERTAAVADAEAERLRAAQLGQMMIGTVPPSALHAAPVT